MISRPFDFSRLFPALTAAALLAVAAVSCDDFSDYLGDDFDEKEQKAPEPKYLTAKSVHLSEDGKSILISANVARDFKTHLEDDTLECRVAEYFSDTVLCPRSTQPVFSSVIHTSEDAVRMNNIRMDVLIDLALPQDAVTKERDAVYQMRSVFPPEYLTLSFMDEMGVREVLPATDYVIANYFRSTNPSGQKYLLRSVAERINALSEPVADSLGTLHRHLVVFSDGRIYLNNRTIDPRHFILQEGLASRTEEHPGDGPIYYVNFAGKGKLNEAGNLMRSLCTNTRGLYQDSFNWAEIEEHFFGALGVDYSDYTIVLSNPSGKVYRGNKRKLELEFTKAGQKVADLEAHYSEGTFYRPVIVDGASQREIIVKGIFITLIIAMVIYLILQLLIPRIRIVLFNRRYVASYRPNMSVGSVLVGSECYYCKAPFAEGDSIVAKCSHVMHKECWDENGYHCPEFGRNCKDGSHYYNPKNLLDPCNASFHMKWILSAVFAGLFSWLIFSVTSHDFSADIIRRIMFALYKIKPGTPEAENFTVNYISNLGQLPSFGLYIGFMLTFTIAFLAIHRKGRILTTLEVLGRSIAGAMLGYVIFLAGCIVSIVLNMDNAFLIDWIPWAVTGFAIAFISTIGTRVRMRRNWILLAIGVGVCSMILWGVIFIGSGVDYRIPLLFSHIIFAVGITLGIAQAAPVSERYYFHVGGAMKEMDIALYKWFGANSNRVVTVGRSVDCDLVMSWDMTGDIAPVQANVTRKGNAIRITPLEEGVSVKGRMLPAGKPYRLYHGVKFVIGKTEFVYQEKDV